MKITFASRFPFLPLLFSLCGNLSDLSAQIELDFQVIPSCNNACTGVIYLNVFNAGPSYSVKWSNGATGNTLVGFCPGIYCVTVTDATGETATGCTDLYSNPAINITTCVSNVSCYGLLDGSIEINTSGGAPPYTYNWTGPGGFSSNQQNLNGVPAGVYSTTIVDLNGCFSSAFAMVSQPPQILVSSVVTNSGASGNSGAIDLSVSGGTPPYSYAWSNGVATADLFGLAPGVYTVSVTDAKGCMKNHTVLVEAGSGGNGNGPTPIILSANILNTGCGPNTCTGSIDLTATGGIGQGFTFLWSNGSTTQDLSYACAGTYCVTVVDIDQNTATSCFMIAQNQTAQIQIQSSNAVFCNYDPNGNLPVCEKVCPHTAVTYFIQPQVNCGVPANLQNAQWTITGAESYTVSLDKLSVTVVWGNAGPGLVEVEGSGQSVCFNAKHCIAIVEEPVAKFGSDPPAPPGGTLQVCKGQTVQFVNQSEHYDVLEWHFSDNLTSVLADQPQHTFLSPGTFSVLLIARSNCLCADTATLLVEVLDTEAPLLDCVGTVCPGETVTYTTSGDCSNYSWLVSPNGTVLDGGGPNENHITVQWSEGAGSSISLSALACAGAACPQASVFHIPVISDNAEIAGSDVVCPGSEEVYSIEAFGGADYVWSLPGGGSIVEGQGTHKIRVVWTGQPDPALKHPVSVRYENCYLGCGGADTLPVTIRSPFAIFGPAEACEKTPVSLSAQLTAWSGMVSCQWSVTAPDGSPVAVTTANVTNLNFTPAAGAGTYRITAIPVSANTCSEKAEWRVQVAARPPKPAGIIGETQICPNTTYAYEVAGTGPYTYDWKVKNGSPTSQQGNPVNITWSPAALRSIAVAQISTDGLGCVSDTLQVNIQSLPAAAIAGDAQKCVGTVGNYSTGNFPNIDYLWQIIPANAGTIKSGQGKSSVEIFWQKPGNHTVQMQRCGSSVNFAVTVHANPEPVPVYPQGICPGAFETVDAGAVYSDYLWKNDQDLVAGTSKSPMIAAGSYSLLVTDANGCQGSAAFTIDEYPKPNVTATTADRTGFCNNSLYVSITALTPDDGVFDYQWFKDNAPTGANQPVLVTNQYGYYSVRVTNEYGCTATDGYVKVIDYCDGPPCHNPSHDTICAPGQLDFATVSTAQCDEFQFSLIDASGMYQAGSAVWHFGESGSSLLGTSNSDNADFTFPNAGKYLVVLYAKLVNGAKCTVVDSVNVEAVAQFSQVLACPGDTTRFTDESTRLPEADIVSWQWDFGEPGSLDASTDASPGYTYVAPGNYTATLTVTAASGCTATFSDAVLVPAAPVPAFTPPVTNCAGNASAFSPAVPNNFVSVAWDFGDPASAGLNESKAFTAFHKYGAAGTYNVTLSAVNVYGCKGASVQAVNIVPNPFGGDITPGGVSSICEGKSLTLNAPAASGASYLWSDGSNTPAITITEEGIYDVTLTNASGCSYSPAPKKVEVNPAPVGVVKALEINDLGQVTGTSAPSTEICAGEDVNLEIQSNGSYNYLWSGGNGDDQILVFSEDRGNALTVGNYVYTVTVTNAVTGCTTVTSPFMVTVNPLPEGFSLSSDNVCAGLPATISYTGPQPSGWQILWNTGETGAAPLVTEMAGQYFVKVVNEYGCVAQSNKVVIFPGPNVAALPSGCHARCSPDTLCVPAIPGIVSWQWYFEGNPVPDATSSQLAVDQSGVYWAQLEDVNGCQAQSAPLVLNLYQGSGDVLGQVWSDVNDNGLIDAQDTLVPDIPVKMLQNNAPAGAGQSSANGDFGFLNILSADYLVQIDSMLLAPKWEIVIGESAVSLAGCASKGFVDLLLDVKPCVPASQTLQLAVCPGNTYNYAGVDLAIGETQAFTFINTAGCDSVVTVTVGALPESAASLEFKTCPGGTYNYAGVDLAVGETQAFTLVNAAGCDSVVTVTVGALPVSASSLEFKTCPGSTYNYAGVDLAIGATQAFTFINSAGCDSVVTVTVGALPVSASSLEFKTCPGSTYNYAGVDLAVGETQAFTFINAAGCDSVVTVTVGALPVSAASLAFKTCPGSTYNYAGVDLAVGATQAFTLVNAAGCDSVVTVTVGALPVSAASLAFKTCPGSTYNYAGVDLAVGETQVFTLVNAAGCDSVVTVTVSALPVSASSLEFKTCPGSTYNYAGVDLAVGETQAFTLVNAAGCDSVVTVTVGALPVSNSSKICKVCPGTTYVYGGVELVAGDIRDFVHTNSFDCDSVVTIIITESSVYQEEKEVSICPGAHYTFNGVDIPAGTTRQFNFTGLEGCDSIIVITTLAWPELEFEIGTQVSCPNAPTGSIVVLQTGGAGVAESFSLNNIDFQADPHFDSIAAGDYRVFVRDPNGCTGEKAVTLPAIPALDVQLPGVTLIPCESTSVLLTPEVTGSTQALQFRWSNGAQTPTLETGTAGPVWVEVSNTCETARSETAVRWASFSDGRDFFYVPNVFSPEAMHQENLRFRAFAASNLDVLSYRIEVFDRWGNFVFGSEVPETGWDGHIGDRMITPGVYVWNLKARIAFCGRELDVVRSGDVTVVR